MKDMAWGKFHSDQVPSMEKGLKEHNLPMKTLFI